MSVTTNATLASVEAKLAQAAMAADRKSRVAVMRELMQGFGELAREVASGRASWDELRGWGAHHSRALIAAREALTDWELEMGEILWRSEEWAGERWSGGRSTRSRERCSTAPRPTICSRGSRTKRWTASFTRAPRRGRSARRTTCRRATVGGDGAHRERGARTLTLSCGSALCVGQSSRRF